MIINQAELNLLPSLVSSSTRELIAKSLTAVTFDAKSDSVNEHPALFAFSSGVIPWPIQHATRRSHL
jgi:hypothetical protein